MNDMLIVPVYVSRDDLLHDMGHRTDRHAQTSDSRPSAAIAYVP